MQNFLFGTKQKNMSNDRWIWKRFNGNETSQRKLPGACREYMNLLENLFSALNDKLT